jgi:hypothetical protein
MSARSFPLALAFLLSCQAAPSPAPPSAEAVARALAADPAFVAAVAASLRAPMEPVQAPIEPPQGSAPAEADRAAAERFQKCVARLASVGATSVPVEIRRVAGHGQRINEIIACARSTEGAVGAQAP